MTPASVADILNGLDRGTLLGVIRYAQRRMNRDALILDLAQSRLRHLLAAPAVADQDDALLTVPEVAERLRLSKPRAYELIRAQKIGAVRIGVRQLRVRRRDLAEYLHAGGIGRKTT